MPSMSGYRLRSAASALVLLRADPGRGSRVAPLSINRVVLGVATFSTDRGEDTLPAWKFYFHGVEQPAAVLALVRSEVFEPPHAHIYAQGVSDFEDDAAKMSSEGRDLTISFIGGPAGHQPCDASYTANAAADARAVAFTIIVHAVPIPPSEACSLVGYRRTTTIRLGRPLAGRVLIDGTDGGPIAVTQTHR
jgi:hypothetical protein